MFFKSALAAGFIAVSAIAAFAPAQAHSLSVGVHSSGGGISVHSDGRGDRYERERWRRGHGHRAHLPLWKVRRQLRHRGFYDMRFVDRHAPVYKLRATGPRGHRVFLVVSSRSGQIIERRRIRRRHR